MNIILTKIEKFIKKFLIDSKIKNHLIEIYFVVLFFILPIRFYIIGNFQGWGIQGVNYRLQFTEMGTSYIPITSEIGYLVNGNIGGISAISIMMNIFSSITFLLCFLTFILWGLMNKEKIRFNLLLIIVSGLLLLLSDLFQYGPFFYGDSGLVIPFWLLELFLCYYYVANMEISDQILC